MKNLLNNLTKKLILPIAVAGMIYTSGFGQREIMNDKTIETTTYVTNDKESFEKREIQDDFENDGKIDNIETIIHRYDDEEMLIKTEYTDSDKVKKTVKFEITTYKYNDKKQIIKREFQEDYTGDGKVDIHSTADYKYNEKGQLTEGIFKFYRNDKKLDATKRHTYEYNDKGKVTTKKTMEDRNADGIIDNTDIFEYDKLNIETEDPKYSIVDWYDEY